MCAPNPPLDEEKMIAAVGSLVKLGLRDAGYGYFNLDDCWQMEARDVDGNVQADPDRFPASHGGQESRPLSC